MKQTPGSDTKSDLLIRIPSTEDTIIYRKLPMMWPFYIEDTALLRTLLSDKKRGFAL